MNMPQLIERINELAKKKKETGLTPEETAEQASLRRIYLDQIKAQLIPQLESITVVDENDPAYIE